MDKDKKITLSLFLTWVIFGLFNLFGQPQAFVPPIMVDGFMIAGLGIYFCFPFQKNILFPLLILFPILFFIISSVEHKWIEADLQLSYIGFVITILIVLIFTIGSFQLLRSTKKTGVFSSIICFIFSISLIDSFFAINEEMNPAILYAIGGIICLCSLLILRPEKEIEHTFKKITLLLSLSVLFDIGNYLALLALV